MGSRVHFSVVGAGGRRHRDGLHRVQVHVEHRVAEQCAPVAAKHLLHGGAGEQLAKQLLVQEGGHHLLHQRLHLRGVQRLGQAALQRRTQQLHAAPVQPHSHGGLLLRFFPTALRASRL